MHKDTEQIHNILKTNTLPYPTDGGKEPEISYSTQGQECCALGVLCVNYDKIYLECDALKQAILRQVFE